MRCATDQRARKAFAAAPAWIRLLAAGVAALLLAGCADTRYYWQSVSGHLQLMRASRPVAQWVSDPVASQQLKDRLVLAQQMRDFSVSELQLPDNPSYRRYAALDRRAVVWNVVAAPALSLTLERWCFPVLGCVSYRGYYDEADARREAAALKARGLEVSVYGVPAYSTLGWMNWAGGDPLLSTFIHYPEGELARLIFHEMAHQVVYVRDDTTFNESFATAVERLGGARWLEKRAGEAARAEYASFNARRQQFRVLALDTRDRLRRVYADTSADEATRLAGKQQVMAQFRERYQQLKDAWGGYAGYDAWVAAANNASLGAMAAYDDLVPGFEALFAQHDGDWRAFYDAVRRLSELPYDQRRQVLAAPAPAKP